LKLYYHPASTTCRPIMLLAAADKLALDYQLVDLFTGENYQQAFTAINPNQAVPYLEDGDFRLGESSAILKYLADKHDSPAYPKDLQRRARVNERMDWFNTNYYREWAYHLIYPQVFPTHLRSPDVAQKATLDFERATRLYDTQSMTKSDFDTARAQYDATQGQLQAARTSPPSLRLSPRLR